jgi:hypothetical protein
MVRQKGFLLMLVVFAGIACAHMYSASDVKGIKAFQQAAAFLMEIGSKYRTVNELAVAEVYCLAVDYAASTSRIEKDHNLMDPNEDFLQLFAGADLPVVPFSQCFFDKDVLTRGHNHGCYIKRDTHQPAVFLVISTVIPVQNGHVINVMAFSDPLGSIGYECIVETNGSTWSLGECKMSFIS